jgi:D-amino-acid oxidase
VAPPPSCPSTTKCAAFDSFSVNAPQYLLWLQGELAALGVRIDRREVDSLDEAFACFEGATTIVNATGLGARTLKGVEDALVEPIRGQTLLAYAPNVTASIMDSSSDAESFYIIPRPGGEVILGGCYDTGSWDTSVDHALARRILDHCYRLDPRLSDGQGPDAVKILRHNVGLRPSRQGGPRLEAELLGRGRTVVHAYGNGPGGYQGSWGIASEVARLVAGGTPSGGSAVLAKL